MKIAAFAASAVRLIDAATIAFDQEARRIAGTFNEVEDDFVEFVGEPVQLEIVELRGSSQLRIQPQPRVEHPALPDRSDDG